MPIEKNNSVNLSKPFCQTSAEEVCTNIFAKIKVNSSSLAPLFAKKIKFIADKVKEVASPILKASISAFLYWVNPSLFAIGFIAGIVFDDHVSYAIQKIKNVWKNQELTGCLIGSFACALSLPVSLAAASLLWSAHLGSLMHPSLDEMIQRPPAVEAG